MVDYAARKELAELIRHLIAGRITNLVFDERGEELSDSDDPAISAVFYKVWCLYDDFSEHRMTGDWRIDKPGRRVIARWILFLQTDLGYQERHTKPSEILRRLVSALTFGMLPALQKQTPEQLENAGVWPFFQRGEFEAAVRSPKLLAGTS